MLTPNLIWFVKALIIVHYVIWIVNQKWKNCNLEIPPRHYYLLYSVFSTNYYMCCSCNATEKVWWYKGKKALMAVQHRPCSNFYLRNCRRQVRFTLTRDISFFHGKQLISNDTDFHGFCITKGLIIFVQVFTHHTPFPVILKSHRMPKLLLTFQIKLSLWKWN